MKGEYNFRIKDLETIKEIFDKHGVKFLITYGALLGFYRDGTFLPGDDDIDLVVVDKVPYEMRKKIGWILYDLGFQSQSVAFNVFGRMEPVELGYNGDSETGVILCKRNFDFTIFFFTEMDCPVHGKEMVCIPKMGGHKLIASPSKFYQKFDTIKINKKKYLTPSPIKDYLEFTYGDWKDKNNRKHGETFFEMHPDDKSFIRVDDKNQVVIWKK